MSVRYLVVGANRGVGFEFVRQLLTNPNSIVVGTYRDPDTIGGLKELADDRSNTGRLSSVLLDMNDPHSCKEPRVKQEAANEVKSKVGALDVLIVNAGINGNGKALLTEDIGEVSRIFNNNVLGPLRVCQTFVPLLKDRSTANHVQPKLVLLSSESGSLTTSKHGRGPAYGISKAGLNMMGRKLAYELESENITVGLLHPGWVQTDMGGPNAVVAPKDSVQGMLKVIDQLDLTNSGEFWIYTGEKHPW